MRQSSQKWSSKFKDVAICKDAFYLVLDIGNFTLRALTTHVRTQGVIKREHGNKGKIPHNTTVNFDRNKGEEIGLPMQAATRASDGIPPVYLPAPTKKSITYRVRSLLCRSGRTEEQHL